MRRNGILGLALAVVATAASTAWSEDVAADILGNAIAEFRNIQEKDFSPEKDANNGKGLHSKIEAIQAAWDTLKASPEEATKRLIAEGDDSIAKDETDYPYLLGASALLFEMNGLDNADAITRFWGYSQDHLWVNSAYTMSLAIQASHLRDERAIPFLKFLLKDRQVDFFDPIHSLEIKWPLTIRFTWGALGTISEPALLEILDDPGEDAHTLISAIITAYELQSLPALERFRKLTTHADRKVRRAAIQMIGRYGHPDDYDMLANGLKNMEDRDAFSSWLMASYDYRDLRVVDICLKLAESASPEHFGFICAAMIILPTSRGMAFLDKAISEPDPRLDSDALKRLTAMFDKLIPTVTAASDTDTLGEFLALPEEKQAETWKQVWAVLDNDGKYTIRPDDLRLTREEFEETLADWTARGRITGGPYEWVKDRHMMSVATADDIPALINLRAACYKRVSDECLHETIILGKILFRLGRMRYRREFGMSQKVELP